LTTSDSSARLSTTWPRIMPAYVVLALLKGRERFLLTPALRPLIKCGQQALSIFTTGTVLAFVGGMVFDHDGTGALVEVAMGGATHDPREIAGGFECSRWLQPWNRQARYEESRRAAHEGKADADLVRQSTREIASW
jgi:hypothetical protein